VQNLTDNLKQLAGRRVLVTGAGGFIGGHALALASRARADVLGLDLPGSRGRSEQVRDSLGTSRVDFREVESLAPDSLHKVLTRFSPELVLHLAGSTRRDPSPGAWLDCARGNIQSAAELIASLETLPEERRPVVVMPGSQAEYGRSQMPWSETQVCRPASAYGAAKLAATELLMAAERAGRVNGCVVRLPLVFGPAQQPSMFIPEGIVKALEGIEIPMTAGRQRRRFLPVESAVGLLLTVGLRRREGEQLPALLNASAAATLSICEVAERLAVLLDAGHLLRIGALASREGELPEAWPDSTLAESLGLTVPDDFDAALRRTVEWYRANRWFCQAGSPRSQSAEMETVGQTAPRE